MPHQSGCRCSSGVWRSTQPPILTRRSCDTNDFTKSSVDRRNTDQAMIKLTPTEAGEMGCSTRMKLFGVFLSTFSYCALRCPANFRDSCMSFDIRPRNTEVCKALLRVQDFGERVHHQHCACPFVVTTNAFAPDRNQVSQQYPARTGLQPAVERHHPGTGEGLLVRSC